MNTIVTFPVAMAAVLIGYSAHAQDARNWDASVSMGYVGTTGNTETQTFNTELLYALTQDSWVHNIKFQGLGASENGETKAERYFLSDKSDFNLDENQYVYGKGSYTDDRFSGFNYQAAVSAGYGRYLYALDNFTLEAYGGAGYRYNEENTGISEGEVIFSVGEEVAWQISDTSELTQSILSEIGDERTITTFEIGLITNIVGSINTKISFFARNISDVPVGRKKTDTQTNLSLVYEF